MSTIPTTHGSTSGLTLVTLSAPDGGASSQNRELEVLFRRPTDEFPDVTLLRESLRSRDGSRTLTDIVTASPVELMMAAAASLGVDVDEVADRLTDDPDSTPADLVIALSWEIWRSPAIRAIGVSAPEAVGS